MLDEDWEFDANNYTTSKKAYKGNINYTLQKIGDVKTVFTNRALQDGSDSKSISQMIPECKADTEGHLNGKCKASVWNIS